MNTFTLVFTCEKCVLKIKSKYLKMFNINSINYFANFAKLESLLILLSYSHVTLEVALNVDANNTVLTVNDINMVLKRKILKEYVFLKEYVGMFIS